MRKDLTELVFILDKSGSMSGLERSTIDGYNRLLADQKEKAGEALVTTVLFNDQYALIHDRLDIREMGWLTRRDYYTDGATALLDAVGNAIQSIDRKHAEEFPFNRPGQVLFVIITDGYENSSREYSYSDIKHLVESHKKEKGWEFLFLGANMDAVKEASRFGIHRDMASDYHADEDSTNLSFSAVQEAIDVVRENKKLNADWKNQILKDNKERKAKKNNSDTIVFDYEEPAIYRIEKKFVICKRISKDGIQRLILFEQVFGVGVINTPYGCDSKVDENLYTKDEGLKRLTELSEEMGMEIHDPPIFEYEYDKK